MLYSEFLGKICCTEDYITQNDYVQYIEPVYNMSDDDKDTYVSRFCKAFIALVQKPTTMMTWANTTKIGGYQEVKELENTLKSAFLVLWKDKRGNLAQLL